MTAVTARELLDVIGPGTIGGPDVGAFVQQTGGGVATIFMGDEAPDRDGDPRYLVAIGPGAFDWDDPSRSEFDWDDLIVGPDGYDGDYTVVHDLDELVAAVKRWLPEAIARRAALPPT